MHPDRKTLLKKYFAGDCSEEEKKIIEQLLLTETNTSLANYLKSEWDATAEHNLDNTTLADERYKKIAAVIGTKRNNRFRTWYWAAAAVLVIGLSLAYSGWRRATFTPQWITVTALPGEQKDLLLPDSSHVWLNSASSVTYPVVFAGDQRKVSIKGEAFFQVTKNKEKPFIVSFNNHYTRVLGTSFNIRAYTEDSTDCVTVIEGSVAVGAINKKGMEQYAVLKANHSIRFLPQTRAVEFLRLSNTQDIIAWQKGDIQFDKTFLPEVISELKRRYKANIELGNRKAVKMPSFTVRIGRQTSLNDVLEILSITNKVTYKNVNDTIVITPK